MCEIDGQEISTAEVSKGYELAGGATIQITDASGWCRSDQA
jgi:hypothetical protein